jgi:SAM-dependent methyltransferase
VLEVGCGEGRVARELTDRSWEVVALDTSPAMIRSARGADDRPTYILGDGTALPFDDGSFGTVVAVNSLMNVNDMPGAVAEIGRVLKPEGRFCVWVIHPMRDAGEFVDWDADSPFVVPGSYMESRIKEDHLERDGVEMTFTDWRYPLQDYARAFEEAGLLIERLREPLPDPDARPNRRGWKRSERVPMFLFLRAVKR